MDKLVLPGCDDGPRGQNDFPVKLWRYFDHVLFGKILIRVLGHRFYLDQSSLVLAQMRVFVGCRIDKEGIWHKPKYGTNSEDIEREWPARTAGRTDQST